MMACVENSPSTNSAGLACATRSPVMRRPLPERARISTRRWKPRRSKRGSISICASNHDPDPLMYRVYLDQKDYSRMAQGLGGVADCAEDAKAYTVLQRMVEMGSIRIYFSWAHFVEALRYK